MRLRRGRFYGQVLSLPEFEPWNLPEPFNVKMYLFATGTSRVKFAAAAGQRPRDADAGPDAPGLRSVTLRVADIAAVREDLIKRGAQVEGEKRLRVKDPDGDRIYIEQAPPDAIKAVASRPQTASSTAPREQHHLDPFVAQYGDTPLMQHREEIAH